MHADGMPRFFLGVDQVQIVAELCRDEEGRFCIIFFQDI